MDGTGQNGEIRQNRLGWGVGTELRDSMGRLAGTGWRNWIRQDKEIGQDKLGKEIGWDRSGRLDKT